MSPPLTRPRLYTATTPSGWGGVWRSQTCLRGSRDSKRWLLRRPWSVGCKGILRAALWVSSISHFAPAHGFIISWLNFMTFSSLCLPTEIHQVLDTREHAPLSPPPSDGCPSTCRDFDRKKMARDTPRHPTTGRDGGATGGDPPSTVARQTATEA